LKLERGYGRIKHFERTDLVQNPVSLQIEQGTCHRSVITGVSIYFFNDKKIDQYALLQKKIVSTIVAMLKKNGWLLYITCSVFKKENEDVVEFMRSNSELELIEMELLKGYEEKADTMFAALFKRNL